MTALLRRREPRAVLAARRRPVDPETIVAASAIVEDVRLGGEDAVRGHAERLGDLEAGAPLVVPRGELEAALAALPADTRALLERAAGRIRAFAGHQRASLARLDVPVEGGAAGQWIAPVERAGCYAPGGRFPLPSTVLMTAVTARVAGVPSVWVASPRPAPEVLAAAAVAGADGVLAVGGAQAIAAMALGAGVPRCDVIVGPGNRWVTAAKKHLAGEVGMDFLAGPSELVVLADDTADPDLVAADLLAQAEHDEDALPVLVTTDPALADAVEPSLARRLEDLPTAATARAALRSGFAVVAADLREAVGLCDALAPEHLEVMTRDAETVARRCRHYGAVFVGAGSAEVAGDYGAGPNHTLPTGGVARFTGGLSVLHFLRVRTWLRLESGAASEAVLADAERLAEIEGLVGHARSAAARRPPGSDGSAR